MEDRISLYPGRVKLVPVEGQENTYDMVRADQPTQEGTPLSRANLFKDTTAALFGLGATAVPDDVLGWIGKYNEYWWSLLHGEAYIAYKEKKTSVATVTNGNASTLYFVAGYTKSRAVNTIQYSKTVTVDKTSGAVSLNSPASLTLYGSTWDDVDTTYEQLVSISPCYVKGLIDHEDSIYYIPESPTYGSSSYGLDTTFGYLGSDKEDFDFVLNRESGASPAASVVSSEVYTVPAGETTYEHSTDRNAYPDSGTVDGITYTYLGRPFEKFPTMPQIETGNYTGTGTYGNSSPNSLTFGFAPSFLLVYPSAEAVRNSSVSYFIVLAKGLEETYVGGAIRGGGGNNGYGLHGKISSDKKTISWYSVISNSNQLNFGSVKYYYIALS